MALALVAGFLVPTLSQAPAEAADGGTLLEAFDDGAASWNQAKGSIALSTDASPSEGTAALGVTYDLTAGTAEAGRPSTAPTFPLAAFRTLKVDYRGDKTYNTLYLKLRDATGEVFMYRLGTLQSAAWTTATVDLTKAPASATDGNADGVLDAPVSLYRFVVARNGTQPVGGSFAVDNLQGFGDGWGVPTSSPDYFAPSKGESTTISIPAGTPGDYRLALRDGSGQSRSLSGTAQGAPVDVTWDGLSDDGAPLVGAVSAVLSYDITPDGVLTAPVAVGVPTLVTVAQADAPSATESVVVAESFDTAGTSWGQAKGTVATSADADHTEGASAIKLAYDLTAGTAEAGWTTSAPSFAPTAYSALRLDFKGDGTYNTLYLRLKDATGEIFYYRVGTLESKQWVTATVDLTAPAASSSGGNANGILDAPVALYRLVVVRNGTQPVAGTALVDNLRTVGAGWSAPTATPEYFSAATGAVATITVNAGTAGDYSLTLSDTGGRTRALTGTAAEAGPQVIEWDGKSLEGAVFQGLVYGVLSQDTTGDGSLTKAASIGVSNMTTVAEVDAQASQSVIVTEGFEQGSAAFTQALGTVGLATSTDHTEGSSSLAVSYNFATGTAEAGYSATPPTWESKAYGALKLDYKGDGSFNTLYVRLRDATGEVFLYRVANINLKTWTTATVDLTATPAGRSGGNNDGVLDAPISLYRISLARNGTQPATGTVLIDNLRAIGDSWSPPTVTPAYFSAASGETTSVTVPMQTGGDFRVTLKDPIGHTRTLTGTATGAGQKVIVWDGKTSTGDLFEGNVGAALAYDTTPDGVLNSPTTMGIPYFGGVTARVKAKATSSTAGVNSSMSTYESIASADSEAKLMEDAYVRYAREEFEWNRVEPRQGYYDWAKFDQTVAVAKARNVEIVGKLVYTADWASSAPAGTAAADVRYYAASDAADWVDYVSQTVLRYKDSVKVWEVWNEPNIDKYWKPAPDPAQYAEMLKVTYATIKAIQPDSTVLIGGLAGFSESYMNGLFAAGAKDSFDGLGLHAYVVGAPESSNIDSVISAAQTYLARKAPGRSIWITEMGWSTCGTCGGKVTEDEQAQYLSRFMIDAASHGVTAVLWFNLREFGDSTSSIDNYGIVERGGRQKPAYSALKRFAMATVQTVAAGTANPGSTGSSTLIDDMATTSGYTTSSLGTGGSTSLKPSTAGRIGGSGALSLTYNYSSATATGGVISMNKPVTGSPTSLSFWVYGDNSNSPLYLKFKDATGESFEAKVGNVGTAAWSRMVFYFDGQNPNYSHSGGDNDGVVDYPISVTNLHVYKSTSGVTSGQFLLDDLTAHFGTPTRGAIFYGRSYVTQAVYSITSRNSKLAVPNTTAYIYDRGTVSTLAVADRLATVTLAPAPKFVISTPAVTPVAAAQQSPVTLSLVTGDRSKLTVQVSTKAGTLVRTLAVDQSFLSGPRSVVWDGKTSKGDWAAPGAYMFRIQTTGPSGESSVITRYFTVS